MWNRVIRLSFLILICAYIFVHKIQCKTSWGIYDVLSIFLQLQKTFLDSYQYHVLCMKGNSGKLMILQSKHTTIVNGPTVRPLDSPTARQSDRLKSSIMSKSVRLSSYRTVGPLMRTPSSKGHPRTLGTTHSTSLLTKSVWNFARFPIFPLKYL